MTQRNFCPHGHELLIDQDSNESTYIVCRFCGSVSRLKVRGDTEKQAIEPTSEAIANKERLSTGPIELASDSPLVQSDLESLQTLDHTPSRNEEVGESEFGLANLETKRSDALNPPKEETFEPPCLPGYTVFNELGRGGMGVVYQARDESLGREVALKTLQRMSPISLQRFKSEFRTLADIAHPNLASLYELLSDGETWCFSMEILEGVDFLEYIWSGFSAIAPEQNSHDLEGVSGIEERLTPERMQRLTEAITQLAVGLNVLHVAGKLHIDVKPSNVLITRGKRLVLLDFGLAQEIKQIDDGNRSRVIQGTPLYMSPEQANAQQPTSASDWYAVGVMLYEVLTGRLPFQGPVIELLKKKRTQTPLPPRAIATGVPEHLSDLCMALLDRDPANRPTVTEVLRCIGADDLANQLTATGRASAIQSAGLVGRERHVEILEESFAEVSQGNTRCLFIHGKSGMGKSVLVRSFLDAIKRRKAAVVLEGRCYEQESVPFKALDSLIDSLAVFLGTMTDDAVQTVMPRDRRALARVFPVLGGVPEGVNANYPSIENADQQELRQRAMNALRELLQRLAIREPLVLYIDDLQWGDVDSAGLLADLVRPPDAPRMLLLVSYRTEDIKRSSCLLALADAFIKGQHLPHRKELSVGSLTEVESTQLALKLLGSEGETNQIYAKQIAQESGGWPFFVWELVQHVKEDPKIGDRKLELDEVIWSRVHRLPKDTIRMLELIAVAGRPISAEEVYQAMDARSHGRSLLSQLRASNFVRTTESENEETAVESYHDRIRESVLNHLQPEAVKLHNLNLAVMIEKVSRIKKDDIEKHINSSVPFEEPDQTFDLGKSQWQRVFDLAYFFDAAGKHRRAFPYALVAAEQARTQNALEVAEQKFRIAQHESDQLSPKLRFRVHEGLGDVLVLRGRYDEANQQFNAARKLVDGNNLLMARIDSKLGSASFKKGNMGDARAYTEKAIMALDERPPSALTVVPRVIKEALIQVLHSRFPNKFVGRKDAGSKNGKLDLFRARIYDQLTFSYWFTRGMKFVLWSHLRQMNLAERYPPSPELGKTYAFHGVTMTGLPMAKRGIAYAQKAYDISIDKGDLWGQGKARSYHTFACIVLARFKEGIEKGSEAVDLLEQAGDVWESNMARMITTVPMYHLGDLKSAYLESRKAYNIGLETGDFSAVCISLLFWIPASPKTILVGAIQNELERPREDPLTIAGAVYARGLELLLCEDQPQQAAKMLQDSLDQAKRLGLRNVCLFSAATWKATALRIVAEREPAGPTRKRAIREATKAVRAALKITKRYMACHPHALREKGLIAALKSDEAQSLRCFDESLKFAEANEASYDRAKTLLARGESGLKFNWANSEEQIKEAQLEIDAIENF